MGKTINAKVAQSVERQISNLRVVGSRPIFRSNISVNMTIRKKYQKDNDDLVKELLLKKITTMVLSITLIDISKVKGNFIYDCDLLDNGKRKSIPIIAIDSAQALAKLEPYVNLGIPEQTLKYMLGTERLNG